MPSPLIYNPAAGRLDARRLLLRTTNDLRRSGIDLELVPSGSPAETAELIRQRLIDDRPKMVAVCGGDGTINSAAVAVSGSSVPLAVFPAGTANVLARELGIPLSIRRAARALPQSTAVPISLGDAGGRPFVMMAGFGFDARVLSAHNPVLKRWFGRGAYAVRCAEELARFAVPRLELHAEGVAATGSLIVAANIARYGGDLLLAPHADPTDEVLDILVFRGTTRAAYVRYLAGLLMRRLESLSDVESYRVRSATIRSADAEEVPGQIDGDTVISTPVTLTVRPRVLSILVPRGSRWDRSQKVASPFA